MGMTEGLISKIQRYSTKDGPGLRSTVFAVGCPMSCLWCANPELITPVPKILHHRQRCTGCGACAAGSTPEERAAACFHDAYERVGITISADTLTEKLLRDRAFYEQSGGGVTYSGGEAALQADFFLEVTEKLKAERVHIALDTSGYLPWAGLEPLVRAADLILFDLKAFDSDLHQYYTGADNRLIRSNAVRIADMGKEMILRLILIPGVNDTEAEIGGRLKLARDLGTVTRVDILKYHRLGAGKYAALGLAEPMEDTPECPGELAELAAKQASDMGFEVTVGG